MRSELACDPTFWTLPQVGEWVRCTIKEGAVVNTDMSFLSDQLFPLVLKIPTQISHKLWELERAHQGKSSTPFVPECGKKISLSFLAFAMVGEIWYQNVFPHVHNLNLRRRAFFGLKIAAAATRLISLEFFEPSVTQSSPIDPCDGWCDRI